VTNRGPDTAPLHLLPTLWFRNTWSWGYDDQRPLLSAIDAPGPDPSAGDGAPRTARGRARKVPASRSGDGAAPIAGGAEAVAGAPAAPPATAVRLVHATHHEVGDYWLACEGTPALLFTENESNSQRLWGVPPRTPYVKDGIGAAVVHGQADAVNPAGTGT